MTALSFEIPDSILFMKDYLGKWPSGFIDGLFDVHANILLEVDNKMRESMKFEMFRLAQPPAPPSAEEAPAGFKKVTEPEPEDEVERLNKAVEKEIEAANDNLAKAGTEA